MPVPSLLALSALAVAALPQPPAAGAATRSRVLMGTAWTVEALAAPDDETAARAAVAALDEVARLDGVLSTWRPDAEMSVANDSARRGEARLSPELGGALRRALDASDATGGAFDPCIGALVDAWDLRGAGRIPARDDLARARAATGRSLVRLDDAALTLAFASPDAWLDTGGFGKGLALDRAADALRAAGALAGRLDAGGQVLAFGDADLAAREIGVADPRDRERAALVIEVAAGSVATSAQSERFVEAAARRLGHVVDPRTGRPVPFAGSATVLAASAFDADVLSTALLVLGPREGLAFARERDLCAAFLVPRAGGLDVRATPCFLDLVREAAADVRLPPASRAAARGSLRSLR